MTAEEDKALAQSEYWDGYYSQDGGGQDKPIHEWLCSFSQLDDFFRKNLVEKAGRTAQDNPRILHLGSGDSTIPAELASRGYSRQLCVDFSPVVVDLMEARHRDVAGIEWRRMDVRDMAGLEDGSVDVAFDKSTLDAMVHGSPWNPPAEVRENTGRYMREVHRVLNDDGVLLCLTFRQPHFMRPLLNQDNLWDMEMQVLGDAGSFDYYGFVLRKATHDP